MPLPGGTLFSLIAFTGRRGRIVTLDVLVAPDRLRRLDRATLEG